MDKISVSLALYVGNAPVPDEFPSERTSNTMLLCFLSSRHVIFITVPAYGLAHDGVRPTAGTALATMEMFSSIGDFGWPFVLICHSNRLKWPRDIARHQCEVNIVYKRYCEKCVGNTSFVSAAILLIQLLTLPFQGPHGSDITDVVIWKHVPHYWPFVRGIHRWLPLTKRLVMWNFDVFHVWFKDSRIQGIKKL